VGIAAALEHGCNAATNKGPQRVTEDLPMTEPSGIGPLEHRRGVAPGIFLIWIVLAAGAGAIIWGMYGNDVRFILNLPPAGAPEHWVSTRTDQKAKAINADEIVGLVKDLQASQQRTADDVRAALQLLTSEQAATKTLSDAVAALQAKVDALQRPAAPVGPKKLAPPARRKPPVPPSPTASPEQAQPEPEPGAQANPEPDRQ
jgi:hypothetical protein